jgi:SAM-dependent methyltransferase
VEASTVPQSLIRDISPNDRMVAPRYPDTYFLWGDSALRSIRLAMAAVGKQNLDSILDLPCGHGRVLRTLKAAFPTAALTACDIDRDGVDFCAETFGATGVYSHDDLSQVELTGSFDLIWVGSLFTHLHEARWPDLFRFLIDHLEEGGLLVFTSHGRRYADQIRQGASPLGGVKPAQQLEMLSSYDRCGFGFAGYDERDDYGLSLSSPDWVMGSLRGLSDLRLALFLERGWRSQQDVIGCQKGFTTPDQ